MRVCKKFRNYNEVLFFLDEAAGVYKAIKQLYSEEVAVINEEGLFMYKVTILLYESSQD